VLFLPSFLGTACSFGQVLGHRRRIARRFALIEHQKHYYEFKASKAVHG